MRRIPLGIDALNTAAVSKLASRELGASLNPRIAVGAQTSSKIRDTPKTI